eukprot:SAG31_NODE_8900_length_1366_cov_1.458564_2_plen_203_part_00
MATCTAPAALLLAACCALSSGLAGGAGPLPAPETPKNSNGSDWAIQPNPLFTHFAAQVSPDMSTAYPRPQLQRGADSWTSLNGLWTVDILHGVGSLPSSGTAPPLPRRQRTILVPYPLEAALSGIRENPSDWAGGTWGPRNNGSSPCAFWYNRYLANADIHGANWSDKSKSSLVILRFEAVMARAVVYVGGEFVGDHFGLSQ